MLSRLLILLSLLATFGAHAALQAIPAGRRATNLAVITIHGPIDHVTKKSLERRLQLALAHGADGVVLDLDTPGGDLEATLEILYLIRTKAPANTTAWIHPKAYSAGTIIALTTREIFVDPNGVFGDAAPIQGIPLAGLRQMAPAERAKIEAPMLSEVVHEARRHGWDEKLVQAFIAVDAELWLIQNSTNGERLFVDKEDYEVLFGSSPPSTRLDRLPPAPARDEVTGFLPGADLLDEDVPTASERADAIEFVQDLPSGRPLMRSLNAEEWVLLGHIVSSDELLVVHADEAAAFGLSSGEAANDQDLAALFGGAVVTRYDETWSEILVRFMTWWPVRGILITIMLVCFFIEMAAPGYGTFGAAAVAAMAVLLAAPLLIGLSEWWTAMLVVGGLALVALELFVIPGVGAIGVIGGLLMFMGLVGTFLGPDPLGSANRTDMIQALTITGAAFFAAAIIIWLLLRMLPELPLVRRFVLAAEVGGSGSDTVEPMLHAPDTTQNIAPGDRGVASTDLHRSGRIKLDGAFLEAQSIGSFIDKGTRVRVVSVEGSTVLVEEDTT